MQLQTFTTYDDGQRITKVSLTIGDQLRSTERTQWIDATVATQIPLTRNGALLREEILMMLSRQLADLAAAYGSRVRP
jgi:hypothetical protein